MLFLQKCGRVDRCTILLFITILISILKLHLTYVTGEIFMVVKMCFVILGYDFVADTNSCDESSVFISGS